MNREQIEAWFDRFATDYIAEAPDGDAVAWELKAMIKGARPPEREAMTFMPVHGACPVCHRDNTLTATPSGGSEDPELTALRAENAELRGQVELLTTSGICELAAHNPRVMKWMGDQEKRTEEAERKLAELQEAFTLRTQLRNRTLEQLEEKKHECLELRSKLATAKRNALEQAANACQDDESGRDGGGYFAEIIRALMKEGGE